MYQPTKAKSSYVKTYFRIDVILFLYVHTGLSYIWRSWRRNLCATRAFKYTSPCFYRFRKTFTSDIQNSSVLQPLHKKEPHTEEDLTLV